MRAYCGQTRCACGGGHRPRCYVGRLQREGVGECTSRGEFPPRRSPWFLDNGAFGDWRHGRDFDEGAWREDVERAVGHGPRPDFAVAPDVVAGGLDSLRMSCRLRYAMGDLPAYLVVQDGQPDADVRRAVLADGFAGIFVGGSLEWKRETAVHWVDFAHELGKPCHIGRMGTVQRTRWAKDIGADSIDSALPLWSRNKLGAWLAVLREDQGRLFA